MPRAKQQGAAGTGTTVADGKTAATKGEPVALAEALPAETRPARPGPTGTTSAPPLPARSASAGSASGEAVPEARAPGGRQETPKRSRPGTAAKAGARHVVPAGTGQGRHGSSAARGGDNGHRLFLAHQRELLLAERNNYTRQAEELKAEAAALALEHEPGDVQFDEEGGEGGTANVDRELDLHLSAQAHAAIEEIDVAMEKIDAGTYGFCENCANPIPKARLEALPHARLCVTCKSGGLAARRQAQHQF